MGHTQSCGCLKRQETRTCVEGTVIGVSNVKITGKNNTSGVKGVYRSKREIDCVYNFKKRGTYLGSYDSIKSAAQARKDAENKLFPTF